jgi:hypothetical protein
MNIRNVLFLLMVCASLGAQTTSQPAYIALREATLSASGEVLTVQQPASPSNTLVFDAGYVYCSAECTFTIERDGTAATTTSLTPTATSGNTDAPTALAFHTSNAGAGTVIGKHTVAAGGTMPFELKGVRLPRIAGRNVTIRVQSLTGTVRLFLKWVES